MKRAEKSPTSVERTISLFTGKTDLEEPLRGRDGTLPEVLARRPRTIRYRWHSNGGHFAWGYGKPDRNGTYIDRGWITAGKDGYLACVGARHGRPCEFKTLIAAAEWVESQVAVLR